MARRLPADPSEAIGIAVVKYNYQAQQPDELSLIKGSRILILEKSNDGWWRGQSGNVAGWFPSNYTQEEGDADDTLHTYAMAENVLDIVVALYSFTSTNDQELSFEKGDRLVQRKFCCDSINSMNICCFHQIGNFGPSAK